MTLRTSSKTVSFMRPFSLGGFDEMLPAGAYSVETDEALLEGVSFPAYRRIGTLIHLHAKARIAAARAGRCHAGRRGTTLKFIQTEG